MKMVKSLALMALGGAAVLAYQRYAICYGKHDKEKS